MNDKIIIGGDFVPTESNYELFEDGDVQKLIGEELLNKLNNADFTIFNLEVPITDEQHPIAKCGPNLIAPTATIKGLKAINPHFFGLANNHILDQGVDGLKSTIKVLEDAGIGYSGVGQNLDEACKPLIKEVNGKRVGIYCCAEHEFSIATESTPGANPFDPLESLDHVESLKRETDFVIVLYHGGKEHYRYPSPNLQKVCRRLVDKGADFVVCQHSHCIGCKEEYGSGIIVYGQGNFLFDNSNSEFWQTGLLIGLNENFEVSCYPVVKVENTVRLADEEKGKEILEEFHKRSEAIKDHDFVEAEYLKFADTIRDMYLGTLSGRKSLLFRVFNKATGYWLLRAVLKAKYRKVNLVQITNYVDCEAHRELMLKALANKYEEYNDGNDFKDI